jgi:tetratricopeptide (TPR) repeat protein
VPPLYIALKKSFKILVLTFFIVTVLIIGIKIKTKSKTSKEIYTSFNYKFKTEKAEQLSIDAFALKKKSKYDGAILLYQNAITIEPDNPKLFFDISECYSKKSDLNNSLLMLDKAIILDSLNSAFYNNRGLVYWKLKKDQNAISDYKKALTLDANNWAIYSNLSTAYYSNKDFKKACESLNIAESLGLTENVIDNDKHLKAVQESCK